jgi:hypothetical protein
MGREGEKRAEEFSARRMVDRLETLYESLAAGERAVCSE